MGQNTKEVDKTLNAEDEISMDSRHGKDVRLEGDRLTPLGTTQGQRRGIMFGQRVIKMGYKNWLNHVLALRNKVKLCQTLR